MRLSIPFPRPTILCALALAVTQAIAQPASQSRPQLSGTWFGAFSVTGPDGKLSHDTAVLLLNVQDANLTGSAGPTIDKQSPFTGGHATTDSAQFHLDAFGGMDFSLHLADGHLVGTATSKTVHADLDLLPAPELVPAQKLDEEIRDADGQVFAAFDACDVRRFAQFLSKDIEFYQDRVGEKGYDRTLESMRDRCAEGIQLRRELIADSLEIEAVPGFGAIEAGTHRFYRKQPDGSEHLDATAQFTNVWVKASGAWKLLRVASFNHH